MSNSWESAKSDAGHLALGTGTYAGLVWIFLCYPAFIIGLSISRMVCGIIPDGDYYNGERSKYFFLCFGVMVFVSIIIYVLAQCRQWFILLVMYLLTLWPFICVIGHYASNNPEQGIAIPLDWCFLW